MTQVQEDPKELVLYLKLISEFQRFNISPTDGNYTTVFTKNFTYGGKKIYEDLITAQNDVIESLDKNRELFQKKYSGDKKHNILTKIYDVQNPLLNKNDHQIRFWKNLTLTECGGDAPGKVADNECWIYILNSNLRDTAVKNIKSIQEKLTLLGVTKSHWGFSRHSRKTSKTRSRNTSKRRSRN